MSNSYARHARRPPQNRANPALLPTGAHGHKKHARPTNPERNIEMRNMEMFHDTELTDGQLQCSR